MLDLPPPPPTIPDHAPTEIVVKYETPSELTQSCVANISKRYSVHPVILSLIVRVEGGWSGAKIENTNGTHDLGLTQINTIHLPKLAKYGLTESMVRNNNCINLAVSAWYIRTVTYKQKAATGEDYLRAIARYHSKNEPHISVYTEKLTEAFQSLIAEYGGLQ